MKLVDSLNYEPCELAFGTSGLRGLVTDMTDLECYINIRGFLQFLATHDGLTKGGTVYLAGDLRDSTPRILATACQAITDHGCRPIYCGLIPTPAVALYALGRAAACIMVTGSHIPADRNGIKFYKSSGEVLKSDEPSIKKTVAGVRDDIYGREFKSSGFDARGSLNNPPSMPSINSRAEEYYLKRYIQIPDQPLTGKHVIVYQHSAVGRDLLVKVLKALGAHVTTVGRSKTFIPIDTENVTPLNKAYFKRISERYKDNFAIVSTDGDSDRPFVIDEDGLFYRGDVLGCLVAKELRASFAATPVSSNDAVDLYLKSNGILSVHTMIGSPYVIQAMQSTDSINKVGWEVNGGFMLGSALNFAGAQFEPLLTRDAFLPLIVTLIAASQKRQKISKYFEQLPARYTGGALIDVSTEAAAAFREMLKDQPRAETLIEQEINDPTLGSCQELNLMDGLRILFSAHDIIHIRPSGNAPQLRIYTNSDTQERADKLAIDATASGGLLERFISAAQHQQ